MKTRNERSWPGALIPLLTALLLLLSWGAAQGDDTLSIRARNGDDMVTLDPAFYTGNEETVIDLAIYSKLIRYTPGGEDLALDAAEWYELSDDGLELEFRLREGIQFHHGYGEMTAEDVKFSFERFLDEDSPYASDWATLREVEVIDRYSGRIILDDVHAPLVNSVLPFTMGSIVSKAAFEDRGERFATNPVGSGPYYFAQWDPNQRMVLERFDEYYGEQPDFRRIEILPIVDPQIAEFSFDAGELDMTQIAFDSIPRYENEPGVEVLVVDTLRYYWLGFNTQAEPFDDIRVREAVRYAVNVDEVLAGAFSSVPNRANTLLAPSILGHWEEAPEYEANVERAMELLAEAGFEDGFSTMITTDDVPEHQLSAAIIQQQLARIGIDAQINIVQEIYETVGQGDTPGMHFASFSAVLDPGYWFEWFTCNQIGNWNYWKWCDEEFDQLKQEAERTAEPEERQWRYERMQEIIDEAVTAVWITNGATVYVYRSDEVDPSFVAMYAQYPYFQQVEE